jgi:serine protease Do
VALDDGRTFPAVIGTDSTDLALLNNDGNKLYVEWGAGAPRVGDWVIAVGNPRLGGSSRRASFRRAARHRRRPHDDFLQIDAPVNRGNSGGPAFGHGPVIGVNTAIYSPSGGPSVSASPFRRGGQDVVAALKEKGLRVARLDRRPLNVLRNRRQHGPQIAKGALIAQPQKGARRKRGLKPAT